MSTQTYQVTDKAIENAIVLARIERAEAFKAIFGSIASFFKGFGTRTLPTNADSRTV